MLLEPLLHNRAMCVSESCGLQANQYKMQKATYYLSIKFLNEARSKWVTIADSGVAYPGMALRQS